MKFRNIIPIISLIIWASSCTFEKMLNYKAQIKGDIIYKDSLLLTRYYNARIDVGSELEFSLDITPAANCSLVLQAVTGRAVLMNKDNAPVKELLFQKLTGKQYHTYTGGYILNDDKNYRMMNTRALDTYDCQDTLFNNNITNRYEFTFYDKRFLTEKRIDCTISFDWLNLANDSVITTKHSILFKRRKYLMPEIIHGK